MLNFVSAIECYYYAQTLMSISKKEAHMVPLAMAKPGEKVKVLRIGGNEDAKQHLADLGFVPDAEVTVVSAPGDGNVIVNLKGATLALTSQMATKIMIQ